MISFIKLAMALVSLYSNRTLIKTPVKVHLAGESLMYAGSCHVCGHCEDTLNFWVLSHLDVA